MNSLRLSIAAITITSLVTAGIAGAQRADENAVTAAQDAFGTSIGVQNVGLYSENDARGFSPQQAGNFRIEGLYFDQQTWVHSDCMVRETTMRVGIAAQSYSFPAPTGIADFSLRMPGDVALLSTVLTRGPLNAATAEVQEQIPLVDRALSLEVCAGYRKNFEVDTFHESHDADFGATLSWHPTATTEIVPFWAYSAGAARRIVPGVYTDGTISLPSFRTRDLGTQDWTTWGWHQTTIGAIAKSAFLDHWQFAVGLFHSLERDPLGFQPYMTLLTRQSADSEMDVAPPLTAESTSGELRMTRVFAHESHHEELQFSIRGRSVDRNFGGDAIIDYGTIAITDTTRLPQPPWLLTPESHDTTRQFDLGVTFEERWLGVGSFAVGVLHDHYRRQVSLPPSTVDTDRTSPWLMDLRTAVDGGHDCAFYGGFVQGLEDSALAPVSALNRNEPPPATRTWQIDGGVRWTPNKRVQFVLGVFKIDKPYFNLDAENVYRQLGRVQHSGLETSLAYSDSGLTLLLGAVRLTPRVERDVIEPGATGRVPLGPVPLTLTVNLDYAPPRWGPWAASLQWNRLSPRVDTIDNNDYLSSLATLDAGLRFHWARLGSWTARLDGFNLTNAQGLHVSSLDVVLPEQSRRFALTLATDL